MSKRFKCDVCNKRFIDKYNLSSHKNVHSSETPFACPQCPYRGKTKKYLARHTKQLHKDKTGEHKCTVCGKIFHHQSSMKVHAMVHTGEKPHSCNVCGKSFRVTYSLNSHMLIHTNEKPFQCSFCDYACRDSSTLRKHQNKHMGLEKMYECKICNKGYKSRVVLKVHISEAHLNVDVRKFPCNRCDKVFKSKTNLKFHIESFHERALVCDCPICGRRLMNKNNLTSHMRTHLEERPFSCKHPGCKVAFKDKNSLTKHTAIHNPDLHFACTYCGRKFVRKTHVQRHELVMHEQRRRGVQCDYCGSKFYSKNYLLKHIQTKHVYKQKFKYICDLCGLVTYNKPSIVMHIKYGHANDNDLQCKICDNKKTYKRHIYLKLHYWNTHSMRYKITRKATNTKTKKLQEKLESPMVEVKVEPIETDSYETLQLLDVHKHEDEDANEFDSLDYSKQVMSEDIAESVLTVRPHSKEMDFDEFFIRHVFAKEENKDADNKSDNKNICVNEEQNEYVKSRIKNILIRTEKNEKAKAAREKRKKEEIEEGRARAERERAELVALMRVREMYNERMAAAVAREKERKEQVKIRYYKNNTEDTSSNNNEITDDLRKCQNTSLNIQNDDTKNEINDISNEETMKENRNNKFSDENSTQNHELANNNEITDDISSNDTGVNIQNDNSTNKIKDTSLNEETIKESTNNKFSDENSTENNEFVNNNEIADDISSNDTGVNIQNDNSTNKIKDTSLNEETIKESTNNKFSDENSTQNNEFVNNNEITDDISISNDTGVNIQNDNSTNKIKDTSLNEETIKESTNDEISENDDNLKLNVDVIDQTNVIDNDMSLQEPVSNNKTVNDIFDQPLLERRIKKLNIKTLNDTKWNEQDDNKKISKMEFKTFQCYVCFKLYQTKHELIDHCQEHFDICHEQTLTKCPMCNHVTPKGMAKHMKKQHGVTIKIPFNKLKDRKTTENGSRYCYDINGRVLEVIPSVKILNKHASDEIDRKRRDDNVKSIAKAKLVKIGNQWIVDKEVIDIKYDEIPELTDRELHKLKITDNDVDRLGQLSYLAKKKGLKMMFPCFNCDKVCLNFSALKLHKRRHDDNPKPFKAKVYKKNAKVQVKKVKLDRNNRTAFPKPIMNKHKCDAKLKEFFECNIRGKDVEFWQFLKIFNKMNREKVNDFTDLENRSDFGNHLDYYKDMADAENDVNKIENDVDEENCVDETENDVNKIENDVDEENCVDETENDEDEENGVDETENDVDEETDEDETENDVDETENDENETENDVDETENDVDEANGVECR